MKRKSGNLLLPWYFQVDCWKVPNNEIDEHVTILECLGGKPLESSVFHGDLTSKKKAPWGSWSPKSSLLLGLIVAESVGFFGTNVLEHNKKSLVFCYWMNFWLLKNHQGLLKSCKPASLWKKQIQRPNSCAFGSGKLSCWAWKTVGTGKLLEFYLLELLQFLMAELTTRRDYK